MQEKYRLPSLVMELWSIEFDDDPKNDTPYNSSKETVTKSASNSSTFERQSLAPLQSFLHFSKLNSLIVQSQGRLRDSLDVSFEPYLLPKHVSFESRSFATIVADAGKLNITVHIPSSSKPPAATGFDVSTVKCCESKCTSATSIQSPQCTASSLPRTTMFDMKALNESLEKSPRIISDSPSATLTADIFTASVQQTSGSNSKTVREASHRKGPEVCHVNN